MKKMTKYEFYEYLRAMVMGNEMDQDMQDLAVEFLDNEMALLDKRRDSARKRAAKKRAESDEMTELVHAHLGAEPATVDTIVAAVAAETDAKVTRNKVVARLTKLIDAGRVVKEPVKVDGAKRMAYRLATEEEMAAATAPEDASTDTEEVE